MMQSYEQFQAMKPKQKWLLSAVIRAGRGGSVTRKMIVGNLRDGNGDYIRLQSGRLNDSDRKDLQALVAAGLLIEEHKPRQTIQKGWNVYPTGYEIVYRLTDKAKRFIRQHRHNRR